MDATVCEDIEVLGRRVADLELVVLGQGMARGDFGRVKRINLVSCQLLLFVLFVAQCLLLMTRGLQYNNQVTDAGVIGLGKGLKCNTSLQTLHIVRHTSFVTL